MRFAVALALAMTLACGCGVFRDDHLAPARSDGSNTTPEGAAIITRVVDGDTLVVKIGRRTERARMIGIDTPESVKQDTPVECFGREAAARTRELLPHGTTVRLLRDVEQRDDYGRLLVYVYRAGDGMFVNLTLVSEGFAEAKSYPPNVARNAELKQAAAEARADRRGLWGACPSRR
jgi:micrococcal nuclease